MKRRTLLLAGGAIVVVAAAVAAVVAFGGDDDPAPAATTTTTTTTPPMLEPIALGDQPLWQVDAMMTSVQIRDGVALLVNENDLSLVDVATGVARWSFGAFVDDLPGGDSAGWEPSHAVLLAGTPEGGASPRLVPHGDGLAVLVEYHLDSCRKDHCDGRDDLPTDESGLALLSAMDGSVLWRTPIMPSVPADEVPFPEVEANLMAANDDTVVVIIAPYKNEHVRDLANVRTVAYDIATGSKRWEQTGVWPVAIAGDTVLGERGLQRPNPAGPSGELRDSTVAALDLATGARKWDLSGRFARSQMSVVAGDVALVVGGESADLGDAVSEVVEVDTGARLTEFGQADRASSCDSDERTLIACPTHEPDGDFALAVFDIAEREVTGSAASLPQFFAELAWEDRVFVTEGGDFEDFSTMDRAGNTIDPAVPGMPIEFAEGYAVFYVKDGMSARTEVYALG